VVRLQRIHLDPAPQNRSVPIRFFHPIVLLSAFAFLFGGGLLGADGIDFDDRESFADSVSNDGAVRLSWSLTEGQEVRLEQSADPGFEDPVLRYTGADSASVLTGLPEGIHYFRLRLADSERWSEPLAVEVRFVSRERLFLLLGAGAVVVAMTVGAILVGFFKTREGGAG